MRLGVLSGKVCIQMVVTYVTCDQNTQRTSLGSSESTSSKLCSSSEQDDDMNPSVASVVFGEFCQKRVPDSHKKDDEVEASYQREWHTSCG